MVLSGMGDRMVEEEAKKRLAEKLKKAQRAGYNIMFMANGKTVGVPPELLLKLLYKDPNNPYVRALIEAEKKQLLKEMGSF